VRTGTVGHIGAGQPTQGIIAIRRFAVRLIHDLRTKVVGRIRVGITRQDRAPMRPNDREDLPIVVIGGGERESIGIIGLRATVISIRANGL
jgi:hypothetical protein